MHEDRFIRKMGAIQALVVFTQTAEEYKLEGLHPRPNTSLVVLMPQPDYIILISVMKM